MKSGTIRFFLFFLFVLAFFSACTKAPKQVEYIPKNAASVIVVDAASVFKKTDAKGATSAEKLLKYFESYGFSNETFDVAVHSIFTETEKTGMNLNNDVMAYLLPSMEFKNAYKCMSVMLDDTAKFSSYIRSVLSENYKVLDGVENGVCYINRNDRFSWVAYNGEIAVFGCSTIHTKGITECVNDIFSSSKKTLAENSDFVDFLESKKDVNVWFSTTEMIDYYMLWYSELPKLLTLKNVPLDVLKDNFIHINFDFDSNINVSMSCTPSRAFKRYWRKNNFTTKDYNKKVCNILPQNTLWFATVAIDPMSFLEQLKGSDYCDYAEKELSKLDLTLDDFAKSFTGDCVFSLYDITLENVRMFEFVQKYEYRGSTMLWKHLQNDQKTTFPHLAIACLLNNAVVPNNVLSHISTEICEQLEPGLYDFSKIMGFPAFVVCKNEYFVITTDKEYARNTVAGKYTVSCAVGKTVNQLVENAQGNASYQYMDFSVRNYPSTAKEYFSKMDALPLLESYSSIVKSAEFIMTDSYKGSFVVEFQDTTQNSLYMLNSLLEIVLP
ncbi:MAG: DUF4836 family protein [Bacteroidales bacterium]|nr:DUF4836 family protein [Bacteroidales bacterium]